jgi:hypothetical protein
LRTTNFYLFAALNLAGAVLVYFTVEGMSGKQPADVSKGAHFAAAIVQP